MGGVADAATDWTPRDLPGGGYCSPACGAGCSREDHERAVASARGLAARLGDGWEPVVWENQGWYWQARCGVHEVNPEPGDTWSAWFQGAVQVVAEGPTPEAALANLTREVSELVEQLRAEAGL